MTRTHRRYLRRAITFAFAGAIVSTTLAIAGSLVTRFDDLPNATESVKHRDHSGSPHVIQWSRLFGDRTILVLSVEDQTLIEWREFADLLTNWWAQLEHIRNGPAAGQHVLSGELGLLAKRTGYTSQALILNHQSLHTTTSSVSANQQQVVRPPWMSNGLGYDSASSVLWSLQVDDGFGIPFRSMRSHVRLGVLAKTAPYYSHECACGLQVGPEYDPWALKAGLGNFDSHWVHWRTIPLCPIWGGIFANTLVWGIAFAACYEAWFFMRFWNRKRRGLCAHCGYQINESQTCPECGRCET